MEGYCIKETVDKGRTMFATRAFKQGDVILEEKPQFSCQFSWNSSYKYAACELCMRPLETAENNVRRLSNDATINLPHKECCATIPEQHVKCPECGVDYCSEECRIEALQIYHATMCLGARFNDETHPLNRFNTAWKNIHLPPETATAMLIIRILAVYKQASNKEAVLEYLKSFQSKVVSEDSMITHKMLGANFEMQLQTLYPLYVDLIQDPVYDLFRTPEAFKQFFALIGTNSQGVGTSAFANWVRNIESLEIPQKDKQQLDQLIDALYVKLEEVSDVFLNNEGSALYLTQSKINHSCMPNAEATFPHANNILVLRAVLPIEAGEEIFISYLDECQLERSRHSRQKELRSNYMFECKCIKCNQQINDADVTSESSEDEDEDEEMDD